MPADGSNDARIPIGDEFIVILPQTTPTEAVLVARRLPTRISGWADDHALQCSLSIGIAEAPTHGNSLGAILQHVDQARRRRNPCGRSEQPQRRRSGGRLG